MPACPRPPYQHRIGQWIVNAEARRDAKGRLIVYKLPRGDGGGTFEVAGINDRFHPATADHLRELIALGRHADAEEAAIDYVCAYTDPAAAWTPWCAVEAYLRDCAFNRGPRGAARIYQLALGVPDDGHIGPKTRRAADKIGYPRELLPRLRAAREAYERKIAPPIGARRKFWQGLVNRWDNALAFAESLA